MGKKITVKEATIKWVNKFNVISGSLIERAFKDDIDNWIELTKPTIGDTVWSNEHQGEYVVDNINYESGDVTLKDERENLLETKISDIHLEHDSWLPMWGTLWSPESLDKEWILENLEIVSECGFRIFEDGVTGDIYLGIDGAGYPFIEAHWMPLYKARGLQWHNTEK